MLRLAHETLMQEIAELKLILNKLNMETTTPHGEETSTAIDLQTEEIKDMETELPVPIREGKRKKMC